MSPPVVSTFTYTRGPPTRTDTPHASRGKPGVLARVRSCQW